MFSPICVASITVVHKVHLEKHFLSKKNLLEKMFTERHFGKTLLGELLNSSIVGTFATERSVPLLLTTQYNETLFGILNIGMSTRKSYHSVHPSIIVIIQVTEISPCVSIIVILS